MRRNGRTSVGWAVGGAIFYLAGLALLITGDGFLFGVLSMAAITFVGVWRFL